MERLQEILRIVNGSPRPVETYKRYRAEIMQLLQDMRAELSEDYMKDSARPYAQTKNLKMSARIHAPMQPKPHMTPEAAIAQAWGSFFSGSYKSAI